MQPGVTARRRLRAKLHEVKDRMRMCRQLPIPVQGAWLRSMLLGHYAYYAVKGNSGAMEAFRLQVTKLWLRSLRRRSHKHRLLWPRMDRLAGKWLPKPHILHPDPLARFDAIHPRQEPSPVVPPAGI